MRLARFNIQTSPLTDKRYFAGMPSPAAAGVIASTVYLYPWGLQDPRARRPALAMVLVPAFLMVSTIRFRSIKAIDVGWRRSPSRAVPRRRRARGDRARTRALALVVLSYLRTFVGAAGRPRRHVAPEATTAPLRRHRQCDGHDRRPRPFSLCTSIVPPLNSMFRRAIGSPRPVPVVFVEK